MGNAPHEKTEYEFAAKKVNDMLAEEFKDESLGFMSFVFDVGNGGYMGYLSSSRRIDALALIIEWLVKLIPHLSTEQMIELIEKIRSEAKEND